MKNLFDNLIYSEFFNKGTGGGASGGNISYQSGYRINSSGEQIAYDGYATSDYIPCELNNVVYLLNIYMKSGVENAGNLRIAFYDSDKVHLGQTNATGAGDNLSGKYEATDGSLSQFTVKSFTDCDLTNVKYFRLCSTKLDGDSVVIVTESGGGSGGSDFVLTNCSYFCNNGVRLDTVELLDTKSCSDFSYMFNNCKNLSSAPELNTSNGIDFNHMFYNCSSLRTIPKLDTSNGTNFDTMFYYCRVLNTIPELDTGNGVNFSRMFSNCSALRTIPELDTSNGTNFYGMFEQCTLLTSIPEFNTSNGIDFNHMFYNCSSLRTIPKLDLDKSTTLSNMLVNCKALENLYVYNIRIAIRIGSSTSYGHLLTVDSLVHTIKELCTVTSSTRLSMGAANLEKIANLYCRVVDDTTDKIEMELCESTDEGAMTLSEYASLKNWTFA